MSYDNGQKIEVWTQEWDALSTESEIRMWDFYGGRHWILKYVPRFGKTVEAGCGLGRYVFYLSHFGIDIQGIDFSKSTIDKLNRWAVQNNYRDNFLEGNVLKLPYAENAISGYLSFGVIEHFIEGPSMALDEAFRVLRPGGIAIITTPSISLNIFLQKAKKKVKDQIKILIKYPNPPEKFFQYWYRPHTLKRYIESSGFKVVKYASADILYMFNEMGKFTGDNLQKNKFAYWFSSKFENTPLNTIGAQSITISVKVAPKMYCFLCGEMSAHQESLETFDVPVCDNCKSKTIALYYLKKSKTKYQLQYTMNPPLKPPSLQKCDFCEQQYMTDWLFEDFGFSKNVCPECLKVPMSNIELSNRYIIPIWRSRGRLCN